MKTVYFTCIYVFFLFAGGFAQVAINTDNSQPDASAMLDVKSYTSGLLTPRMSSIQRNGINNPAIGLLVFQTDSPFGFYFYTTNGWMYLGSGNARAEGGGGHVIDADGNAYPTVKIGNQEWMAENLRVTHYRNGDDIPYLPWAAAGAYYWYNNDPISYKIPYGALYNGYAVNDSRNICPVGWHIPNYEEFLILEMYLGNVSTAGGKMKTCILWNNPNTAATNISGFSGVPGGKICCNGTSSEMGACGFWWSSPFDATINYYRSMYFNAASFVSQGTLINNYLSVRCISNPGLTVGQNYQGGKIFFIDATGEHGLIAAPADLNTFPQWGCFGTPIVTSTVTGTGQANTTAIVSGCNQIGNAAMLCDQYSVSTIVTYSDWYLPSKDELNLLYQTAYPFRSSWFD